MFFSARSSSISIKKGPIRVIAFITLWSFFVSNIAWAAGSPLGPTSTGSTRPGGLGLSLKPLTSENFDLPHNLGEAKVSTGRGGNLSPVVINIQDAHTDYSCQKAIQGIVEYLNAEYGVDTALLEGGAGKYDLSPFTDIEDKALRERVADYFVRRYCQMLCSGLTVNASP